MSQFAELGRTRLYTKRERRRLLGAAGVALVGAVLAAWLGAALVSWLHGTGFTFPVLHVRPVVTGGTGDGGVLGLPHDGQPAPERQAQFPLTVTWPASPVWTAVVAAPLWVGWWAVAVRPLLAALRRETRHRGLAHPKMIAPALGVRALRRSGRFTLPGRTVWTRLRLPPAAFGFFLGYLGRLGDRRMRLWANWEQRVRIVGRTGWGKTARLLVPLIRALPGPALINSTEPAIFEQTVLARQFRRPALRWRWLTRLLRRWLSVVEYPVAVVDLSAPEQRFAAGYPRMRWSPILGCEDFTVAFRRAVALLAGVEGGTEIDSTSDTGQFFRHSATEVFAAWLHAAALGGKDMDSVLGWLHKPDDPTPVRILRDDRRANPSAAVNLRKHLDPRAGKTTSGVERYLALLTNSLTTDEARDLIGAGGGEQFDMAAFIAAGGTLYLLAEPSRIDRARPLLSLIAAEMFLAAETVALRSPHRRLSQPYVAVLDELRYAITVTNLPYVASVQRKYGITYVYSVQSSTQEDAVYGKDAPALRQAAGISIYGGIDIDAAGELSQRAGLTPVVTPTRGRHRDDQSIQLHATLTVGDQQQLADGEAVFIARGLPVFLGWMPSIYKRGRLDRRIRAEAEQVARKVAGARQRELGARANRAVTAATGATLSHRPGAPT